MKCDPKALLLLVSVINATHVVRTKDISGKDLDLIGRLFARSSCLRNGHAIVDGVLVWLCPDQNLYDVVEIAVRSYSSVDDICNAIRELLVGLVAFRPVAAGYSPLLAPEWTICLQIPQPTVVCERPGLHSSHRRSAPRPSGDKSERLLFDGQLQKHHCLRRIHRVIAVTKSFAPELENLNHFAWTACVYYRVSSNRRFLVYPPITQVLQKCF